MVLGVRPGVKEIVDNINIYISMLHDSTSNMKEESVTPHVRNKIPIEQFKVKRGQTIGTKGILNYLVRASIRLTNYVQKDKARDPVEKDFLINQAILINNMATRMLAEVDSLDALEGREAYNAVTKVYQEAVLIKPIKLPRSVA